MPGPGGGAHGGGGHGGGSHGGGGFGGGHGGGGFGGGHGGGFGGGPRPGGFGGGPRPGPGGFGGGPHGPHGWGPRPPRGPHWGRGPRRYGGGGGCLSFLLAPIIIVFVLVFFMISIFGSAFASIFGVTKVEDNYLVAYNENNFQDYADAQYRTEFGSSAGYEDNILLTVLVNDECNEYYYIAWVGDNIAGDINDLFGNEQTELGRAMSSAINTASYKYSLDSNLASVVSQMSNKITSLGLDSSFIRNEEHNSVKSHLTNKSSLPLTDATVNDALERFTEETGISIVIVVDNMMTVFGEKSGTTYSLSGRSFLFVVLIIVIIAAAVYFIVRYMRKRKEDEYYNSTK